MCTLVSKGSMKQFDHAVSHTTPQVIVGQFLVLKKLKHLSNWVFPSSRDTWNFLFFVEYSAVVDHPVKESQSGNGWTFSLDLASVQHVKSALMRCGHEALAVWPLQPRKCIRKQSPFFVMSVVSLKKDAMDTRDILCPNTVISLVCSCFHWDTLSFWLWPQCLCTELPTPLYPGPQEKINSHP